MNHEFRTICTNIVLSSRVRLARNFKNYIFPTLFSHEQAKEVIELVKKRIETEVNLEIGKLEMLEMNQLQPIEKQVLVEKHLISPQLIDDLRHGACLLSENEVISVMINEEDHLRIQCLMSGLQLTNALQLANVLDDWMEEEIDYAYDEERGYLTSCPTNVGTGLRASVMMHLPGLVLTRQLNQIIPAINQLGLVVRGMYGEGSQALGNIFQISNQITLGKSEQDIVEDLTGVVQQIIAQERAAREALVKTKEASTCISDVRLGIDLGFIKDISKNILNELMILTQPGFLQKYAGGPLRPFERDMRRAGLIRERLNFDKNENS
jgi:protein arginine kinase